MVRKYRVLKMPIKIGDKESKQSTPKKERINKIVSDIEKSGGDTLGNLLLTADIEDNIKKTEAVFKDCYDFTLRRFTVGEQQTKCAAVYINGIVKKELINASLLKPLMTDIRLTCHPEEINRENLLSILKDCSVPAGGVTEAASVKEVANQLLLGSCVLFIDGTASALAVRVENWETRSVDQPTVEASVRGPLEAFVENIAINTSLMRKRLKSPDLKLHKLEIGRLTKTTVIVAYIKGIADEGVVGEVNKRLAGIDIDIILGSGYIEQLIADAPLSPFPQAVVTERPDSCVGAMAEGRVVILCDGSPFALIVPSVFVDFLTTAEDYYFGFIPATFLRLIRYLSFSIALFVPSLYIALTTYHQEMIPTSLLMRISSSHAEVPFPAVVEAFLMEVTFEILREAGLRLPKAIGQAVSIVGALVIGETAVSAGIVSHAMVIVVALTGIASFAIPKFNAAFNVRLLRFPMMILGGTLGVFGIIIGLLIILIHMASLRSVGVPYLSPITPSSITDLRDSIVVMPLWLIKKRPSFIPQKNATRMGSDLKPKPPKQDNQG